MVTPDGSEGCVVAWDALRELTPTPISTFSAIVPPLPLSRGDGTLIIGEAPSWSTAVIIHISCSETDEALENAKRGFRTEMLLFPTIFCCWCSDSIVSVWIIVVKEADVSLVVIPSPSIAVPLPVG